jgi:hypothetical protein
VVPRELREGRLESAEERASDECSREVIAEPKFGVRRPLAD